MLKDANQKPKTSGTTTTSHTHTASMRALDLQRSPKILAQAPKPNYDGFTHGVRLLSFSKIFPCTTAPGAVTAAADYAFASVETHAKHRFCTTKRAS